MIRFILTTTLWMKFFLGGFGLMRFIGCLVLMISISGLTVGNGFAYQEEVDWIWNDTQSAARLGPACLQFIVKAYPIRIVRGNVSGRTCVERAIKSYRRGDHEEALGWILAGQCHNPLARQTLVNHAPNVLEYVLQHYGRRLPGR